jgi:hypothetical protein
LSVDRNDGGRRTPDSDFGFVSDFGFRASDFGGSWVTNLKQDFQADFNSSRWSGFFAPFALFRGYPDFLLILFSVMSESFG